MQIGLDIDTQDSSLAPDLVSGAKRQIDGPAARRVRLRLESRERPDGHDYETASFLLTLDTTTDRDFLAQWLADFLDPRAQAVRIDGTTLGTHTEKEIRRFLGGRNLILCSDGTGNAGGKTRGTNVFRTYNYLDRHNAEVEQLAFYNDGVGTDSGRLLKALGGAFGWGLTRNVIELYAFAAQHYQPGDRIYLFGFSRGAYTVRVLAGMILTCGLLTRRCYLSTTDPHRLIRRILRGLAARAKPSG